MHIPSYPSIYNLGHPAIANLFDGPVIIQEKVDGSQFSFSASLEGGLFMRSKGVDVYPGAAPKLFSGAVETVRDRAARGLLTPGMIYRGEVLQNPRHNALQYARVPLGHIILFDVCDPYEDYSSASVVAQEARSLELEVVPTIFEGMVEGREHLEGLLDRESVLGGCKIEGVVIKPQGYDLFGRDKKVVMGKVVSEAFREVHKGSWKEQNPTNGDVISGIVSKYRTEARWKKAIQHLRDDGVIEDSPTDIGPLLKEINQDVLKECREEISEMLFDHAWKQIARGLTAGFPEWYKEKLIERQFE